MTARKEEIRARHQSAMGCDFCGLPVYDAAREGEPRYCCYGCRFAASIAAAGGEEGQNRWAMTRLGLAIFFAMNVMVFTMLLWSQPAGPDRVAAIWYELARHACLLFTLPVVFLLGVPLVEDAAGELVRGRPSLSLLLVIGVAAALAYSIYSLLAGGGHVYFEVAATILVAVTLGRWLEATGKLKTTEALRGLVRLLPDQVRLIRDDGEKSVPAGELRPGDVFRVLPGERIAADGSIVRHQAAVDEQAVTGESSPVIKHPGNRVLSGTLVLDGPLEISATSAAGEGTMARMIAAVAAATASRTRYQRLAERASAIFLPAVAIIALGTFAVHAWLENPAGGLLASLAVLVIACPCALALATPMALWAAVGRAAQAGVLVRHGDALSLLARAKTICFDKTGTLTTGQSRGFDFMVSCDADERVVLRIAAGLAELSAHPLAQAVAEFAATELRDDQFPATSSLKSLPGRGVEGHIDKLGQRAYLGSGRWMTELGQQWPNSWPESTDEAAETFIAWGGHVRGRFLFRENLRPDAPAAVRRLQRTGIKPVVLSGDRELRVAALAAPLGMEPFGELLPEAKLAEIQRLQQLGPVVMVGDGINDAPALAAADVGIALGSGTDISRHAASVCLLASDLSKLPWLVGLSRQTVRTIRWNLFWAFAYNSIGIALAAAGWLHPVMAAIAMGISSLLVVSNSLRLAHFADTQPAEERFQPHSDSSPLAPPLPFASPAGASP
jgi:heavy metal translocating P-type ATPase